MSIAEIERFVADLKSSEVLRAEAGKIAPRAIEGVVAFAVAKGYTFTADEATAAARELSDAELQGVVGGISDEQMAALKVRGPLSDQQKADMDAAQDALKAENIAQTQQADVTTALSRLLQQTIQGAAKNVR